jgi:hypothetical protein
MNNSYVEWLTEPQAHENHRVLLLRACVQVLDLKRDEIPEDLGLDLIGLGLAEMTREKVFL